VRNNPLPKTSLPPLSLPLQPIALRHLITDAHGNAKIQLRPDKPQDAYRKETAHSQPQPKHPK
jgi:hypothetical protein